MWTTATLLLLQVTVAATPGMRTSKSDEVLKSPEILQRKPVLIYYANDRNYLPGEDESSSRYNNAVQRIRRLAQSATGADQARLTAAAAALEADPQEFIREVDKETAQLRDLFCRKDGFVSSGVGLVVLRNHGSTAFVRTRLESVGELSYRIEYCFPNSGQMQVDYVRRSFDDKTKLREVLETQPLAVSWSPEFVFEHIQKLFPAKDYRFIFYGKSRGTKTHFFEGPLPSKVDSLSDDDLRRILEKVDVTKSSRMIAAQAYDALMETGPPPEENPNDNPFLEKGTFLSCIYLMQKANPLTDLHFSHVVLDVALGPIELSSVRNARDFLREPPSYTNIACENVDYLHLRESVDSYRPFQFDRLFPVGRPVDADFMEHFRKHIEAR